MGGLPQGAHLHACKAPVLLRGVDDEFLPVLNGAAHIIGQTASRVGDVRAFGENQHLVPPVLPLPFGGGLGACGHAAND